MTKQNILTNEMEKGIMTGNQVHDLILKLSKNKQPLKSELSTVATEFYKNNPSKIVKDLKAEEDTERKASFLRTGELIR